MNTNDHSMLNVGGIFPPIPTPFDAAGKIDFGALKSNLARWEECPLAGYVVGGSNGEFISLTLEEMVDVVRFMRREIPEDRLLIAGTGLHSTDETIRLSNQAAMEGADALLVITPHYYRSLMTMPVLVKHFLAIAGAVEAPVILYNVPANTGIDMSVDAVAELAAHENIIGIKDSSGNVMKIGAVVHSTGDDFQVLAGSGGFFLGALSVGAVGAVAALANIASNGLASLLEAFRGQDIRTAQALQLRLIEPNTAVTARFGVPGLKAAMDMLGYYGGPVRRPLQPLGEPDRKTLEKILLDADLLPAQDRC
jgi:4-hydroxy-2-oxoglutarate aldolase